MPHTNCKAPRNPSDLIQGQMAPDGQIRRLAYPDKSSGNDTNNCIAEGEQGTLTQPSRLMVAVDDLAFERIFDLNRSGAKSDVTRFLHYLRYLSGTIIVVEVSSHPRREHCCFDLSDGYSADEQREILDWILQFKGRTLVVIRTARSHVEGGKEDAA